MPVPLMNAVERAAADKRNGKLWAFVRANKWSYDDVLRALFCYVLDGKAEQLDQAADWIEDFLNDLNNRRGVRRKKRSTPS